MTAYTSTGSGNWKTAATWGGGGYPSSSADTATIAAGHTVTIAQGDTVDCGAITLNAGATHLVVNGRLNMNGTLTTNTGTFLEGNGAFIIDLKGNAITMAGSTTLNMIGTAGARGTFYSSTTAGTMTDGFYAINSTWKYVDVSNLSAAVLGRSHNTATRLTYWYCTFTGMTGRVALENTGTSASAEYDIQYCDFRNPGSFVSTNYQPFLDCTTAPAAGKLRQMIGCTWDSGGTTLANRGVTFLRCNGMVFRDNVFKNWTVAPYSGTSDWFNNVLACSVSDSNPGGGFLINDIMWFRTFRNNYCYYTTDGHPFPFVSQNSSNPADFTANVFDGTNALKETNWFLSSTGGSGNFSLKQNLVLGKGNLYVFTNNATFSFDVKRNTAYMYNGDTTQDFPFLFLSEQSSTTLTTGTARILNNLVCHSSSSVEDYVVSLSRLQTVPADVIDYFDHNCGWGYSPDGAFSPPLKYNSKVTSAGSVAPNDFSQDPGLVDKTRNIATWDSSLGGAGTAANAITNLLSRTAGYTPSALMDYVFSGFRFTNTALKGAGENGENIGAANYYDSSRSLVTSSNIKTYFTSKYAS